MAHKTRKGKKVKIPSRGRSAIVTDPRPTSPPSLPVEITLPIIEHLADEVENLSAIAAINATTLELARRFIIENIESSTDCPQHQNELWEECVGDLKDKGWPGGDWNSSIEMKCIQKLNEEEHHCEVCVECKLWLRHKHSLEISHADGR